MFIDTAVQGHLHPWSPSGSVKIIIFHCRDYRTTLHLHLGISTCVRAVVVDCTHLVKGIILHLSARWGSCYCWVWYYPLWHWKIDEPSREAALQRRDNEKYYMYLDNCINIILSLATHKVWTEISQYSDQQLLILSHLHRQCESQKGNASLIVMPQYFFLLDCTRIISCQQVIVFTLINLLINCSILKEKCPLFVSWYVFLFCIAQIVHVKLGWLISPLVKPVTQLPP